MVLDLCCGQGRHTLSLAQKYPRVKFHGHDQSDYLIDLAQKRNTHKNARFTVGDCREIPAEKQFDLVLLMGNSFGYFENDEGDVRVLEEIQRVLKVGGVLCVDLTDGEFMRGFDERSWEWIDKTTFTCRQRELSEDGHRYIHIQFI